MDEYRSDVEYETEDKKSNFKLTRGKLIILVLIVIVVLIIIIIAVSSKPKKKKQEYTSSDFEKLEQRMKEEAPIYLDQKNIELDETDYIIDLRDMLLENGGSIDKNKVKAAKICDGYVVCKESKSNSYNAYINCKDYYTTDGYENKRKSTTLKQKDTEKPKILLIGEKEITLNLNGIYEEPGYTATDNIDGDLTNKVKVTGVVDTKKEGTYTLVYTVSDSSKNEITEIRKIKVVMVTTSQNTKTTTHNVIKTTTRKPVVTTTQNITRRNNGSASIRLKGSRTIEINLGSSYKEEGYSATSSTGYDITSRVLVSGNVNTNKEGTYYVKYSVKDNLGSYAEVTRTVIVKNVYIKLKSISFSPDGLELSKNTSKKVTVFYNPTNASNKSLSWYSSNNSCVRVDQNGNVTSTSKTNCSATITASSSDGVSRSMKVIVK